MKKLKKFKSIFKSEYTLVLILILICIIISIITPRFAAPKNLFNIMKRTSTTGIIALGMTYVISTGGIDVSVGGQVSLISVLGAMMLGLGWPFPIVIIGMIIIGASIGSVNGTLVSFVKLPPFMVTLAMMNITNGLAMYITKGKTLYNISESFSFIGQGNWIGMPIPAIIFIILSIIAVIILRKFTLGRKLLAVGGNQQGAWYAGINVKVVKLKAYIIIGITAGISSIILVSRLLSASPSMGSSMEMDAIAAVVIGGTSLAGGNGLILGTVAGALIIEIISNWMNLMAVNPFLRGVIKGIIIIIALIIGVIGKNKNK